MTAVADPVDLELVAELERPRPSLGCAACGACCDPVFLDLANVAKVDRGREQRAEGRDYPPDTSPTESLPFILDHWTELERGPDGASYSCDRYDPATRRCLAHDGRPDVCRDFPYYGHPIPVAPLPPECSYALELSPWSRTEGARPLIPIRPVHR